MPKHPPSLEFMTNAEVEPAFPKEENNASHRRIGIFVAALIVCLVCGLSVVLTRQPVYKAAASVLTVAQNAIDEAQNGTDDEYVEVERRGGLIRQRTQWQSKKDEGGLEHVSIQKQILLGVPLLEETLKRIKQEFGEAVRDQLSIEELQSMLAVESVTDTNLVELQAQGHDPKLLAQVVNAWLDAYQQARENTVEKNKNNTTDSLENENARLDEEITAKRRELDQFRRTHDILSRNDTENQAMARLSGLNAALNKSSDDETKSKAKLDAIKAALAKGEPVLPPEEQQGLESLEKRAHELRELLKDMRRRYTPQYISLQPKLKVIPEQLAQTEEDIQKLLNQGQRAALSEAEQGYASARQTTEEVRRQIAEHKREAADFTARFAEYESMSAELEQMEALYRENQSRLVEISAKQIEKYPQLEIVERAYIPTKPIGPNYWRDSGIVVGGSIGAALLITLLYDYLVRQEGAPSPIRLPDIKVFSVTEDLLLRQQREEAKTLPTQSYGYGQALTQPIQEVALESPLPRELGEHELKGILEAVEPMARQVIGLILSGITLEEAVGLGLENFDLSNNQIKVSGPSRDLPLAPRLKEWLTNNHPIPLWAGEDNPHDIEDLSGVIACAMTDAGIFRPETVDAAALRHTYVMYLVRQGIRLAELERVVGKIPPKLLARYARYSPAGPGLRAESVSLIYPALT